ncbi:MAG: MoaD/ThiS family protein [Acidobacteriota bacterium]|nr:MoaD/ThiS family protein [Acidobacteriota bacterium]MDQ7088243.1 MoaD/ThiS family protein [Acidobacteriota bacterium]
MEQATIRVRVRCFSHLRYELGTDAFDLDLPAGCTLGEASRRILEKAKGKLEGMPFRMALNGAFAEGSAKVAEGDELALIPPVQGG